MSMFKLDSQSDDLLLGKCRYLFDSRTVKGHGMDLSASFLRESVKAFLTATYGDDIHTFARKPLGELLTNPAGGTGDKDLLVWDRHGACSRCDLATECGIDRRNWNCYRGIQMTVFP